MVGWALVTHGELKLTRYGMVAMRRGAYGTIFGEMALQNDKDRAATIESGSQR